MSSSRILTLAALVCGTVMTTPVHSQTAPAPAPAPSAAPAPPDSSAAPAPEASRRSRPRRDRNALTAEEIHSGTQSNMYEVIRQLRPRWFGQRGDKVPAAGLPDVQVYMNDVHIGELSELRSIDPRTVTSARFLSAPDASIRFGANHFRGAILLSTRTDS